MNSVEVKRKQIQIISYIFGLIAFIVFGRILGDNGIVYLAAAIEIISCFVIIFAESVSDALGRMLRGRSLKGQYKSIEKVRKNVMFLQSGLGLIGSALLLWTADILAQYVLCVPYSALVIRIIAPVVFLRCVSGVLLGYFQGKGTEMPTAVTSVLRQVFFFGFGLLFCKIFQNYGEKVSSLLREETFIPMYSAAGIAVAMLLTEILLMLFLLLIYLGSRKQENNQEEILQKPENFGNGIAIFYRIMNPLILMQLLKKIPIWAGILLYQRSIVEMQTLVGEYGVYYGKYFVLCAFPIFLCMILLFPGAAKTAVNFRKEEYYYVREIFCANVKAALIHTLFTAIFLAVMAKQIAAVLFGEQIESIVKMLIVGSSFVVFSVLGLYFVRILLWIGKSVFTLSIMGIYAIVGTISIIVGIYTVDLGIVTLVYAGLIATAIICISSGLFLFRKLEVQINIMNFLVIPVAVVGVSGVICAFLGRILTTYLGNLITILICLLLGSVLCWTALLLLKCVNKRELELVAGGKLIIKIGKLFRII